MEEIKTGVFKIKNNIPIYVIGDIHGDYQCLIHCLVDLCNVATIRSIEFDNKFDNSKREILEWENNNNSIVVFCGDLIHRKRFQDTTLDDECSDIFIIKTLLRLKKKAQQFNGDLILISGNHEIMNITNPSDTSYTSDKNLKHNKKYFSQQSFVDDYIQNSYAWVKLNDILIAHGGLCSDYLKFLDQENEFVKFNKNTNTTKTINTTNTNTSIENGLKIISNNNIMIGGNIYEFGDDLIEFVNDKYKCFFTNYSETKHKIDQIGYKLFIEYDLTNKHSHNIFWCREWGYAGINCNDFNKVIEKIGCTKMIIGHCPQFLSEDKSKMINFECEDMINRSNKQKYKIARVDLGMSRSFEYNKADEFVKFLSYNHNRKISILKLLWDEEDLNYYFNSNGVITYKISCLQYLLIKYGIQKKDWNENGVVSNWLGFKYIDLLIDTIKNNKKNISENCLDQSMFKQYNPNSVILCLLYPIIFNKPNLKSVQKFNILNKNKFQ